MEDIENKLKELENRVKDDDLSISTEILKEEKTEQPSPDYEPKMTQEQANAVMNVAKDTKAFINVKLSQKANDLIENDDSVKERFTDLAKDTVKQSMDTFDTKNKLESKKNYYDLNEKDVTSLGGDKTSTKGQQFSIVMIKRFFWILFMATLGAFYIAPLSVIVELFQGISFRNIEREEYTSENDKKVRWIVKRHKLGMAGTILGWIVGLAFCGFEVFLTVKFPLVFLWTAVAVFGVLLIINIAFGMNRNTVKRIFKKINREDERDVEIQEENE